MDFHNPYFVATVMTELTTHAHDGPCCVIYVGYLIGMLK